MTAIVGVAHNGRVVIGGDSAGVAGLSLTVRADLKVFRRGPMIFGFTSSFRMGQLLRYSLEVPEVPDRNLERWLATKFIDSVRTCLAAGGFRKKDDEVESGGTFLVGVAGRLYQIASDFQVGRSASNYDACGSGADIALGSLYTSTGTPRHRVLKALRAAERWNAGVRRPFRTVSIT